MHETVRQAVIRDTRGILADFPWVRTALWATIPSGDPEAVRLRFSLAEAMLGKPFSSAASDYVVTPRVVHLKQLDRLSMSCSLSLDWQKRNNMFRHIVARTTVYIIVRKMRCCMLALERTCRNLWEDYQDER